MKLIPRLILSLLAGVTFLSAFAKDDWVSQPIHRTWTYWGGAQTRVRAVERGVVYYTSNSSAGAIDIKTGKLLWRAPRSSDQAAQLPSSPDSILRVSSSTKFGSRISGVPVFIGDRMICLDGTRILCYAPGAEAQIPIDRIERKKRGEMLAAKFADLDAAGELRLIELGDEATPTLINKVVEIELQLKDVDFDKLAYDEQEDTGVRHLQARRGTELLEEICTSDHAELLASGVGRLKGERWTGFRLRVIEERVNVTPGRIAEISEKIKKLRIPENERQTDLVFFGQDVLPRYKNKDPQKQAALNELYGLLRASRASRKPVSKWEDRVTSGDVRSRQLAEGTANDGRSWQLFESYVLGSNDLYIREKLVNGFGPFLFLGVEGAEDLHAGTQNTCQGVLVTELIKGKWLEVFPNKDDIRIDSDGDGLTDLVEGRIQTDKTKKDTDGDGVIDSLDASPLAKPLAGPPSDRQKIVAAIVSDLLIGSEVARPALLNAGGDAPFQFSGYPGILVWPVNATTGSKMLHLSLEPTAIATGSGTGEDWLSMSASGRRARTQLVAWSGPLAASWFQVLLEKVGDDWFVVEAWITGQS